MLVKALRSFRSCVDLHGRIHANTQSRTSERIPFKDSEHTSGAASVFPGTSCAKTGLAVWSEGDRLHGSRCG